MNASKSEHEAEDQGEVFLNENDIVQEIPIDESYQMQTTSKVQILMKILKDLTIPCTHSLVTLVSFTVLHAAQQMQHLWQQEVVMIWDSCGELAREIGHLNSKWVKWHPRGHLVLAGCEDGTVWMWNADKDAYLNMFTGHGESITCGDFTPDGKTICTGSDDATLRIWNPKSGENIHVVRGHPYHTEGLTCMAISSDSTLALTGSKDGSIHMVNISTGRVVSSLISHTDSVECVGFSLSGPWAATGSMDQKLIVWDLQHSTPRITFDNEDGVTCLSWLGNSRYIASGCVDGKVRIWDSLSSETAIRTFSGHAGAIQSIGVSANGDFLVSVSIDGTARVFEIGEFR